MGAPQSVIDARTRPQHFEVWPENWQAFEVFMACQTQWRTRALGGVVGLDYQAVESAIRMLGIKGRRRVFQQLRDFEKGALEGFEQART